MASAKRPTVYYDNILSNSKKLPDMKAIIDRFGKTAGYKDVINVCDAVEKLFLEIPVKAIDRIVIFSGGKIHMSLLLLPVVDNAIYVPLDMELTEDKYEYFFNLLKVTYVLTDDTEHIGCKTAEKLGIGIIKYNIQGNFNEFTCNIELLKRCRISADSERPANPEIMMIGMTSGTTSTPKIVPTTYKGQIADYYAKQESFGYGPGDVVLVPNRILNSMAMGDILAIWSIGGTAVVTDGFDHSKLFDTLVTNKVTIVRATPAVLSSFVGYAKKNNLRRFKSDIKYIRAGGAPLLKTLKEDIEDVFGAEAVHAYGMTEAKSIATTYKAPKGYKEGSAGVSIGPEIRILDDEILIKGDTVFIGYENPEIDNSQYFTDGWFHTGDMGYIDEDGYIFITGRIKEMINRGGEKISPYEVEKAILEHPEINDAAVFPYPNEYGSENAGAVIVTKNDGIDLTMLRRFLHEKVSPYKMPTKLYTVNEIPKSENNKVQRKMLYDQLKAFHPNADSAYKKHDKQKLTKTQRTVKKIWKKALFRKNIELDDNFHDIGGDSLNGMLILGEIERKFKIKV
ncbi:MAG: AMP-binding protein, partial [Clostridia bacterium]|nr:AMP-binding protein [Clostridia bacterium]